MPPISLHRQTHGTRGSGHFVVVLVLLALIGACTSSSPTENSTAPIIISGDWAGFLIASTAQPATHCFASGLARVGGTRGLAFGLSVSQVDGNLTASQGPSEIDTRCEFSGEATSDGFILAQAVCTQACAPLDWTPEAGELCELEVCFDSLNFSGRFVPVALQGEFDSTWSVTDQNGEQATLEVGGSFEFAGQ